MMAHLLLPFLLLLAVYEPLSGQSWYYTQHDSTDTDLLTKTLFDPYFEKMVASPQDSIFEQVLPPDDPHDSYLDRQSPVAYQLRFTTLCSYMEVYPISFEPEFVQNQVMLCRNIVSLADQTVYLDRQQRNLIVDQKIFEDVTVSFEKPILAGFEHDSPYRMISYDRGRFLVLEQHYITQHGNQTSYGLSHCYYLERKE